MARKTQEASSSILDWLKQHEDWLSFGLGVLALIIIVVGGIWYLWGKMDGKKIIVSKLKSVTQEASESSQVETKKEAEVEELTTPAVNQVGAETEGQVYVVKKGDSLWKIAETVYKDGYRWLDIAKANKLANPNILLVGQKLTLPGLKTMELKTEVTYQVKRGDTLFLLSQRFYGDGYLYPQVAKYNGITNPDLIEVDQVIKFPPKVKLVYRQS